MTLECPFGDLIFRFVITLPMPLNVFLGLPVSLGDLLGGGPSSGLEEGPASAKSAADGGLGSLPLGRLPTVSGTLEPFGAGSPKTASLGLAGLVISGEMPLVMLGGSSEVDAAIGLKLRSRAGLGLDGLARRLISPVNGLKFPA